MFNNMNKGLVKLVFAASSIGILVFAIPGKAASTPQTRGIGLAELSEDLQVMIDYKLNPDQPDRVLKVELTIFSPPHTTYPETVLVSLDNRSSWIPCTLKEKPIWECFVENYDAPMVKDIYSISIVASGG